VSTKEKRLWKEEKDVDDIKGGYKGKKNHFLNYNPYPFHLKLPTSILTLHFPPKNLRFKPTKSITKPKTC
jgi:hypothetical protein